jgi:excisionase family DNA binding protein
MTTVTMTIREAAEKVGRSVKTLRRAIKAGRLEAEMDGGKYIIAASALDEWRRCGTTDPSLVPDERLLLDENGVIPRLHP